MLKKQKETDPGLSNANLSSSRVAKKVLNYPYKNLRGSETILVVEDEEQVRELVIEMLKAYGYTVFDASDGKAAIQVFNKNNSTINLILTDVVMPEMSGRKMIDSLENFNGKTKVIYMSGYSNRAIDEQGILEPGSEFIQKPFSPSELLQKIRQVLDT